MVDRYPHKIEFVPVANANEYLRLMPDPKDENYYAIDAVFGLPLYGKDFGAFTTGQTKEKQEVTEVYQEDNWLAQIRFVPIDAVEVIQVWKPRAKPLWSMKTATAKLVSYLDYADELVKTLQLTEIFQWQDTGCFFDLHAPSAISTSVVRFYGYKFLLRKPTGDELQRSKEVHTKVWVEGA